MRKIPSSSPELALGRSDCKGALAVHAGEGCSVAQLRLCKMGGGEGPVPGDAAEAHAPEEELRVSLRWGE